MDVRTPVSTNYGKLAEQFREGWKTEIESLQKRFGAECIEEVQLPGSAATDMPNLFVKKDRIVEVLDWARSELGYDFLCDLTATDETPEEPRFLVVYHLKSMATLSRLRFKCRVRDGEEVPTLTGVWPGANWAEREVWDMFGIRFSGHPNLKRILMDQRWEGHPLRKDYPLRGYQIFPTPEPVDEKELGL